MPEKWYLQMIINSLIEICVRCFCQNLVSSRLWESDACCLAALACSKVTLFFSMNVRSSSVALAWIWLLYSQVWSSIFLALSSHKMYFSKSFRGDGIGDGDQAAEVRLLDLCNQVLNHNCLADHLNIDWWHWTSIIAMVWPAAMCTCEQRWYSASGRLNSQSAISTFSRGALMIWATVDLESVRSPFIWFPLYVLNL